MSLPAPSSFHTENPWSGSDPDPVYLLTPDELGALPHGTKVTSIFAEVRVVGVDTFDNDTRYGWTAWGLRRSQFEGG